MDEKKRDGGTCESIQELIVWYPGGMLGEQEREIVEKHLTTCPECAGQGTANGAVCGTCGGNGRIQQGPRIVTVSVPPRVWNGSVIRVPGAGKSPPHVGQPGDLVLSIRVQPCW